MKKLNLKIQELTNPTVLTRKQLKNVMGGDGTETTIQCAPDCYVNGPKPGQLIWGTCSHGTSTIGGITIGTCICSLTGGSSCNVLGPIPTPPPVE